MAHSIIKECCLAVGLVQLMSVLPGIAAAQTFLVDRYTNNAGPSSPFDPSLRLINVGLSGNPSTSPVGDVCANIYVFDNNQAMIACCSCPLRSNELASASIGKDLTNNPLTSIIPSAGVINILPTIAGTDPCSPMGPFASPDASLVQGFSTHIEVSGPATYITETALLPSLLGSEEAAFLPEACFFVQYLGGARGICGCSPAIPTDSPALPTYSCRGFESPFNVPLVLKQKVQRTIPVQAQLYDVGKSVTDTTIAGAAPVVHISFTAVSGAAVDESSLLEAAGQSGSGRSFSYSSTTQTWQYNMSTKPFTASGTYTVFLSSGDPTKYSVSPTCSGTFVRQ